MVGDVGWAGALAAGFEVVDAEEPFQMADVIQSIDILFFFVLALLAVGGGPLDMGFTGDSGGPEDRLALLLVPEAARVCEGLGEVLL